jgi:hypothetical protein
MSSDDQKKNELLAKRQELLDRLEAINLDYRRGLDADSEERAMQLENAEVLEGIARAAQQELDRINQELAAFD